MSGVDERIARLEERLAWFERHAIEQDRAVLELAEDLTRLRAEVKSLRERAGASAGASRSGEDADAIRDERPPHY